MDDEEPLTAQDAKDPSSKQHRPSLTTQVNITLPEHIVKGSTNNQDQSESFA